MNLVERLNTLHRMFRYRVRSERLELQYLLSRRFERGSLFDVGAYRGVYSYWMHRRFRDMPVVAFEPQPELVEFLTDLKATFRLDRLVIAPVGLSSRCGTLPLHRARTHWGGGTIDSTCYEAYKQEHREVFNIPVTTIDEFVAEHPTLRPVRFIKCDVECHEDEVIAGAEQTLHEDRPELLVEWLNWEQHRRERFVSLTRGLDYSIYAFGKGGLTHVTNPKADYENAPTTRFNYLLLPREKALAAA